MSDKPRDTLTVKVDAAFRQATAKVIERARQTGTPVIVWEDGQVKEYAAEELEGPNSQGSPRPDGTCKDKRERSK
ncbi:MAG: hypothetical protein ACHRXM_00155 [Isosphaerales bacterium]